MEFTDSKGFPGPSNDSVLWLQDRHISTKVWNHVAGSDRHFIVKSPWVRCNRLAIKLNNDPRVLAILYSSGFYGVHRIGFHNTDHHLISALIERWHRETHTFHLNSGEATVTLEDMAVLFHLPIDGEPVTGSYKNLKLEQWSELTMTMFGWSIEKADIRHHTNSLLKLTTIYNKTSNLIDEAGGIANMDQNQVEQVTRSYMLCIIAFLFSTTSGDSIDLSMVQFIADVHTTAPRYSWGGALLACMYRHLCNACMRTNMSSNNPVIGGPMMYLQVWAWTRLPSLRPKLCTPRRPPHLGIFVSPDGEELPKAPPAAGWLTSAHNNGQIATHCLRATREALDALNHRNFVWRPYDTDEYAHLPPWCPPNLFDYDGPVIFWHMVEHVRARRVLRQFGLPQYIPEVPPRIDDVLHSTDKIERIDYTQLHRAHIEIWNSRAQHRVEGLPTGVDDQTYYTWYYKITRRAIINPQSPYSSGYPTGSASFSYAVENQLQQFRQSRDKTLIDNVLDLAENHLRGSLPTVPNQPCALEEGRTPQRRRTTSSPPEVAPQSTVPPIEAAQDYDLNESLSHRSDQSTENLVDE